MKIKTKQQPKKERKKKEEKFERQNGKVVRFEPTPLEKEKKSKSASSRVSPHWFAISKI